MSADSIHRFDYHRLYHQQVSVLDLHCEALASGASAVACLETGEAMIEAEDDRRNYGVITNDTAKISYMGRCLGL